MATVYKAKCTVLNRYVAVKILRDEFTTDEDLRQRHNLQQDLHIQILYLYMMLVLKEICIILLWN